MSSSDAHLEFAPAPDDGNGRALVLAVGVHALLLLALNWGTLWSQQPQDMSVEAELWSAVPQPAAPKAELPPEPDVPPTPEPEPKVQNEPPSPVAPPVKTAEAPKPMVDPQIAIDKLKKKQAEKEEEAKRKAQEKQEAKEAQTRHQEAVKRLQSMAGSAGTPVDTGVAPKASGPSASYIGRLRAKVKPNITFPDNLLQNVVGNPTAEVEVTCSPSGKIEDVNLVKSSGNNAWDEAVLNGLRKTAMLPRDVDGSVPTRLVFSFRPRD
jgi:colicin import membrane protein